MTCQVFMQDDLDKLLRNKFVVIIGDSVQRGIYKDLVRLLNKNQFLTRQNLRAKGEPSFDGDKLIEGGRNAKMTNGVNYREVRQYKSRDHLLRFYFVTRCYSKYLESILADFKKDPKPDVVLMNSCLWDITRYGRNAINEYKFNLQRTIKGFKRVLPASCMFVWNCTLPISRAAKGGFLIPEVEFMNGTLRLDIIEANFYAREIVTANNFDVLDLHFHLRCQLGRRTPDGIHWDMAAHRHITNLILNHIAKAWNYKVNNKYLAKDISITVNFNGSSSSSSCHNRSRSVDVNLEHHYQNYYKDKNHEQIRPKFQHHILPHSQHSQRPQHPQHSRHNTVGSHVAYDYNYDYNFGYQNVQLQRQRPDYRNQMRSYLQARSNNNYAGNYYGPIRHNPRHGYHPY